MTTTMIPTADEQAIREVAARVFADRVPLADQHERVTRGAVDVPRELFAQLGELGFFAQSLPESAGGLGLSTFATGLILEAAGRELVPGPLIDQFVALRMAAGSPQAEALATGTTIAAVAFDTSVVRPDGAHRALDGEMTLGFADSVDRWLVPIPGAIALVCADATGAECKPGEASIDPLWRPVAVRLARVEPLAIIPAGEEELEGHIGYASVLAAAFAIGASARVLEDAIAYAKERRQFGRPVGSFQAVKHHLANAHIELLHTRNLVYRALADDATAHDYRVARLAADRCYRFVAGRALQVHGGIGFTAESTVHLFVKNAQRLRAWPRPVAQDRELVKAGIKLVG